MATNAKPVYKRILLKLSGEALQGSEGFGIDASILDRMAQEIKELVELGIQVGVVIGGGNLFRGAGLAKAGMNRVVGDHMGMLATVMNGLAMRDALHRAYVNARLMSAIPLNGVCDNYSWAEAISLLRNKQTGTKEFRDLVGEIATLLCYEATRDLPLEEVEIETPITMAKTKVLAGRKLALVPILRAGMGMLDGMLTLLPAAKVGFIGLYRDEETLQPVEYFCKLPQDIAERDVLVLDPMLATGGSAIDAITQIKKHGAKRIKFIGLLGAPEGIKALHEAHPDVDIYLGAQDDRLNENGYIVPGLGDAGDRIYGTK